MIADSVAGQARIPHALRRLLLEALRVRERHRDVLAGTGEVIQGTAAEIEASSSDAEAADRAEPEPALPARAEGAIANRDPSVGQITHPALAGEVAALERRLDALLRRRPTHRPNQRLLRHLESECSHLLTFLTHAGVEATNWRAEQAIRPAVVNRKSWGGNRSWRGARTQQVAMSVIRTARQQGVDPIELMAAAQREREPKATELLRIPARASPDELGAAA